VLVQTTFPRLMLDHAKAAPHAPALREKVYGIWQTTTWAELALLVRQLACGMAEAGLRAATMWWWWARTGRACTPACWPCRRWAPCRCRCTRTRPAEFVFPINNAEVRLRHRRGPGAGRQDARDARAVPAAGRIWYDDPRGLRNYDEPGLDSLDALMEAGARAQAMPASSTPRWPTGQPQDVAAMFFTSGTTGNPKGVVHTHFTLLDRAAAGARFDKLTAQEEVLAYLPPAWIGQNIFSYAQWLACGYVVNCPESAATVTIDLKEIGPTYYFAPPRVFEGLLTSVMIRMEDASAIKRGCSTPSWRWPSGWARRSWTASRWASARQAEVRWATARLRPAAQHAGLQPRAGGLHRRRGHRPRPVHLLPLIGINLKQLYGSTETAVFVCLQPDHEAKADTVGVPIEGVEIKLADNGEILVKSPGLLKEYYKNPVATAEVLTPTAGTTPATPASSTPAAT
jgi:long-chain acyl-CoA synthetase